MVAHGTPCLGPVTHAGCGAICPAYDRGCYGCFGPMETPNTASLSAWWRRLGVERRDLVAAYRHVNAFAEAFRRGEHAERQEPGGWLSASPRTTNDRRRRAGPGRGRGRAARARSGTTTVEDVRLEIYEPPRFFEALLRDRPLTDAPDITSRICGICPIAYQMSACAAIEDALGVEVDEPIWDLRRLIYCGEWLESHALHVFMLHAPDFLGYEGAIEMARDGHRELVERGLRHQEGRQRPAAGGRRPRGAPDQRARRRLLPGAGARPSWRRSPRR